MTINGGEKQKPLVSFIITDYNISEEMLRECIDSIISLDLQDDEREIILVDDGSDVPPVNVINHYGKRIKYFRQTNRGLSAARNAGIALAKGEYLQFVDGDDCLITEAYDKVIALAKNDTEVDMLMFCASRTYKHYGTSDDICFRHTTAHEFLQKHNLRASACCYMFRHAIIGEQKFKDGILHEDELFTPLLMCKAGKIAYTYSPAYYYRQREDSIMTSATDRHTKKRLNDFFSTIIYLSQLAHEAEYRVLRRRVDQLCMDYMYNVATLCRNYSILREEIARMKKSHLYPITMHCYSMKYLCFSILSRTKVGCRLFYEFAIRK